MDVAYLRDNRPTIVFDSSEAVKGWSYHARDNLCAGMRVSTLNGSGYF